MGDKDEQPSGLDSAQHGRLTEASTWLPHLGIELKGKTAAVCGGVDSDAELIWVECRCPVCDGGEKACCLLYNWAIHAEPSWENLSEQDLNAALYQEAQAVLPFDLQPITADHQCVVRWEWYECMRQLGEQAGGARLCGQPGRPQDPGRLVHILDWQEGPDVWHPHRVVDFLPDTGQHKVQYAMQLGDDPAWVVDPESEPSLVWLSINFVAVDPDPSKDAVVPQAGQQPPRPVFRPLTLPPVPPGGPPEGPLPAPLVNPAAAAAAGSAQAPGQTAKPPHHIKPETPDSSYPPTGAIKVEPGVVGCYDDGDAPPPTEAEGKWALFVSALTALGLTAEQRLDAMTAMLAQSPRRRPDMFAALINACMAQDHGAMQGALNVFLAAEEYTSLQSPA